MKILRNILLVNLCALGPLWWALFGWMPDQAKIYMRGQETPGVVVARGIAVGGGEYGTWEGGRIYRYYLREGMGWKDLAFRLPGEKGASAVERIELQKWKLLVLGKAGRGLGPFGESADEYAFQNPRFERLGVVPGKISCGLGALEILLLGVSWWCAQRHREEPWRKLWPSVLCMALTLTALMQVALPVQSYWANRSAYAFSAGELWVAVAVRFLWMSVLAVAAVGLLVRCFGRWVLGLVFAFTVCVYLESGILSNGLAKLNGDIWLLQNRTRALWDAAAWTGVFAVVAMLHGVLRKHYGFASMCLLAMVAASMLDTKREKLADKPKSIVDQFVSFEAVIKNVKYSPVRNVLVFILDSMEREQAHAVMEDAEAGAELKEKFRGFTEYTNHVGALPMTMLAVPNLLTGLYPDDAMDLDEYAWLCYSEKSVLRDYLETGHEVYVTTPGVGCGYASKTGDGGGEGNGNVAVLRRSGNGGEAWSLLDFSRWRWLPFFGKAPCSFLIGLANGINGLREWSAYATLAEVGCDAQSTGVFMLVHTMGVHIPVVINRRGEMAPAEDNSSRGCVEQGVFILKSLAELLDAYRRMGVYDNSLIMVLGDHGGIGTSEFLQDKANNRLPGNARPFLWIKPAGSQHDFVSSPLPTSSAQVADLLKRSAETMLPESEIQAILQADRRVYRRLPLVGRGWTDWIVERDGRFEIKEQGGVCNLPRAPSTLQCGHLYSLYWTETRNMHVDLSFAGADSGGYPCMLRGTRKIFVEFHVPEIEKAYRLKLELYDGEGGTLRFRAETADSDWSEFPVRPRSAIVLGNLRGNEDGLVRIVCERGAGPEVDVAFSSVLLEEEK